MFKLQRAQSDFSLSVQARTLFCTETSTGARRLDRLPHFVTRLAAIGQLPSEGGFFLCTWWLAADLVSPSPAAFWLAYFRLPNRFDKSR